MINKLLLVLQKKILSVSYRNFARRCVLMGKISRESLFLRKWAEIPSLISFSIASSWILKHMRWVYQCCIFTWDSLREALLKSSLLSQEEDSCRLSMVKIPSFNNLKQSFLRQNWPRNYWSTIKKICQTNHLTSKFMSFLSNQFQALKRLGLKYSGLKSQISLSDAICLVPTNKMAPK